VDLPAVSEIVRYAAGILGLREFATFADLL